MHILIISNNYKPELTGPAGYITDLAEFLVQAGEQVSVVTSFPHYPQWRLYPGYCQKLLQKSSENGVNVFRCPIYIPRSPATLKRIAYDISFTISSIWGSTQNKKIDLIYCVSPPLTIGLTAQMLGWLKRCPFIFHIMDLIPDTAVALGMLNNQLILNILRIIELHVYRAAAGIVVISPGFKDNLKKKGIEQNKKIALLPNWIDSSQITPGPRLNGFRRLHSLDEDAFVITYAGNMGNKQGLETLLKTAELMNNPLYAKYIFLMVGEGARKNELCEYARQKKLKNVIFLPLQAPEIFPQLLAASDILALTQKRSVTDICLPGKLMTSCASGRPILAAVNLNSETAKFVQQSGCGMIVEPENPEAFKQALLQLRKNPQACVEMGKNGRNFVVQNYSRENTLQKYRNFIHEVVEANK